MKVVRRIGVLILFILAVLLAGANEQTVDLVYLPALPVTGFEQPRAVALPMFLLVLAALALGGILGGGLALFQQASLKMRLQRSEKDNARLTNDVAAVREKLGLVTAQLDEARRDAAELRTELEQAGGSAASGADPGGRTDPAGPADERGPEAGFAGEPAAERTDPTS